MALPIEWFPGTNYLNYFLESFISWIVSWSILNSFCEHFGFLERFEWFLGTFLNNLLEFFYMTSCMTSWTILNDFFDYFEWLLRLLNDFLEWLRRVFWMTSLTILEWPWGPSEWLPGTNVLNYFLEPFIFCNLVKWFLGTFLNNFLELSERFLTTF